MQNEYAQALNDLLVEGFRAVLQIEEQQIRSAQGIDLTINELHMLEAIGKSGDGIQVKDVAKALQITLPSVSIATQKLERKGYIVRRRGIGDGRSVRIVLTAEGERVNRIHAYFHERMVRSITDKMTEKDREVFFNAIYKLDCFFKDQLSKIENYSNDNAAGTANGRAAATSFPQKQTNTKKK
ncbi:MAG: MarR family transcriptional regulator [Bacteroidales bacterium]|nr:MarR family transcriptional regulator [Bacteroidales bacterium]